MMDLTFGCRWVRPLPALAGYWKRQLPTKHLNQAARGDLDYVTSLVTNDPSLINQRGPHGRTFLWEAVRKGRVELMEWLLARGANPNLTGAVNSESLVQLTPMSACIYYQKEELQSHLYSFEAREDIFRQVFRGDQVEVLEQLVKQPSLLHREDPHDQIYFTPLASFAIVGGEFDLLVELVERGSQIEVYSQQLLHLACHVGRNDILEYLLEHGAIPVCATASLWMSTRDLDLLRTLVEHGLSANQRPYSGLTPLLYACRADNKSNLDKIRFLLELGADPNVCSSDGRSPLHYAAVSGELEICELLLQSGVNVRIKNRKNQTATDIALERGHLEVVELIKEYQN